MRFLDNVLRTTSTARRTRWRAPSTAPTRERSVGLGVMGFHSFLQARGIAVRRRDGEVAGT